MDIVDLSMHHNTQAQPNFIKPHPDICIFADTPFGALPILEIDHGRHIIAQSTAIGRYLAKRFGMQN